MRHLKTGRGLAVPGRVQEPSDRSRRTTCGSLPDEWHIGVAVALRMSGSDRRLSDRLSTSMPKRSRSPNEVRRQRIARLCLISCAGSRTIGASKTGFACACPCSAPLCKLRRYNNEGTRQMARYPSGKGEVCKISPVGGTDLLSRVYSAFRCSSGQHSGRLDTRTQ